MSEAQLGVLGRGALATVDDRGAVATADLTLDWWIGAHDRWHVPAEEASTSRRRLGVAPVWETTVRVPRGEVAHRAYGVTVPGDALVAVDVENRSPVPLTVGLVVRVPGGRVEIEGATLRIDGEVALALSAPPRRWAAGDSTAAVVMGGEARGGAVEGFDGPGELALLFPVPHGTSVRAAIGAAAGVNPRELPDADAVARGWDVQLERGLQAELPPPVGEVVDAARADLLLGPRDAAAVAALEDWAFDDEAAAGWSQLGWRDRRRARRRAAPDDPWAGLRAVDAEREPARFLSALRGVLVREHGDRVDVLPGFPPDWLGQPLTVSAVPLRAGTLAFAVRWHGARPALLWDAPAGVQLSAPTLDPSWSTAAAAGETLLSEPPRPLLSFAAGEQARGESVDAPGAVLVTDDERDERDERDDHDDLVSAGLYDPAAADAAARLALLVYLTDEIGASIPEIVQAHEEGGILSFAAIRTLRPDGDRSTLSEIAARAGIELEFAAAIWRAAGFPDARPYERRFSTSDVIVFELVRDLGTFVGREHSLQLVRTAGEAIGRVAEAEIALLRSNVEAPLAAQGQFEDVARTYTSAARQLFPRVTNLIETFHRHQLEMIGNRYSAVNAPTSSANVVELAVGFADIAGYTGLSHRLDAPELSTMLAHFEATTGNVIAASGANVAKRIGDAVMFVTNAPGIACALALELIEACARERLPKLRVGLAVGEVIVRQGDFYGPTVNLAARLVASAEPGTALTDATLHNRLSRVRVGYGFAAAGRFQLAGFDEPLEVFQLIR